ncbi:hypothetical protein RJ55_06254 [Drechmeria coniospora]|nr:hypothetical protein RJ55_06254 [Drechmeria coniospora]
MNPPSPPRARYCPCRRREPQSRPASLPKGAGFSHPRSGNVAPTRPRAATRDPRPQRANTDKHGERWSGAPGGPQKQSPDHDRTGQAMILTCRPAPDTDPPVRTLVRFNDNEDRPCRRGGAESSCICHSRILASILVWFGSPASTTQLRAPHRLAIANMAFPGSRVLFQPDDGPWLASAFAPIAPSTNKPAQASSPRNSRRAGKWFRTHTDAQWHALQGRWGKSHNFFWGGWNRQQGPEPRVPVVDTTAGAPSLDPIEATRCARKIRGPEPSTGRQTHAHSCMGGPSPRTARLPRPSHGASVAHTLRSREEQGQQE